MNKLTSGGLTIQLDAGTVFLTLHSVPLMTHPEPLFLLWEEDGKMRSSEDGTCSSEWTELAHAQMLSVRCCLGCYQVRIDCLCIGEEIRLSYTADAQWPDGPRDAWFRFPWLAALQLPDGTVRYPSAPMAKASGAPAMQLKGFCYPPYCLEAPDGRGLAAYFPVEAAGLTWDGCKNAELGKITSRQQMENHRLKLRLSSAPSLAAEMYLWPLEQGWPQAFRRFRQTIRRNYDLSQYAREDLRWIENCTLTHFTYAFGREFLDEAGLPEPERLARDGEAFGGYDAVILWHEYPRLGVDERTQWDLFADYPGGMEALASMIRLLHSRSIRVIIPFKPWDRSRLENDEQTTRRIARLIRELDADGIFFDTMNTVPSAFRRAIDAERPGVVFMVESEPCEQRAIESITCSWNQYHTEPSVPEANLLRFLFPEQTRFAIARWHSGALKDQAIERAVFNGEGMVIWQDVFGCWLPYTQEQKDRIAQWKQLLDAYRSVFRTPDAVPLLPTLHSGVYANGFFAEDRAIITLYNDTESAVEGKLLNFPGCSSCESLRDDAPFTLEGNSLVGCLPPHRTVVILLK